MKITITYYNSINLLVTRFFPLFFELYRHLSAASIIVSKFKLSLGNIVADPRLIVTLNTLDKLMRIL